MVLTAVGTFGFLTHAHLDHVAAARQAVDGDAAPVAGEIGVAESEVADFDHRIAACPRFQRHSPRQREDCRGAHG
jgi:glyoxylase-like metal-dependent hydrolase (beta-lactamase superfamily II)